jgi:predicted deacylase
MGGTDVAPGTRQAVPIEVTTGLNGAPLRLWVHVLRGRGDGPTLALLSTLHGGEWFSIPVLRELVASTDLDRLNGTILAVPVANPPALTYQTRSIPDESDSPDLNRIFPGTHTWTSDQIIATLVREVLTDASVLLDFHMGPWGSAFRDILIGADFEPSVSDESERLALAFGSPVIRRANVASGFPGPRSAIGYAGSVLGIPALGVEVGGVGFGPRLEGEWKRQTLEGIQRVMHAIGMLDGDPPVAAPARQLIYRTSHRVNPRVGGMLRSRYGGEALGAEVEAGSLLGEVVSPYTFGVLEELRAPADGLLFYTARDYPVHPGDWAFGIADTDDASARWVETAPAMVGVA